MVKLRRSLAYSAAQSYLGVALQLVSTVVLSRILTPAEVGVFAVAAVFAALASNFRDFGIAEYLIQAKNISPAQIRAAFAVNIALSWGMGLMMFLGAGLAGDFYRSTAITEVMRVQAFNFLLIPFGAINAAWFRRELNFKPLFFSGTASDAVSLGVAIWLALQGFGAMSMAWSSLAGVLVSVAILMAFRPRDFPRWPSLHGAREVLHFGSYASVIYVLGQLGRGAPEMIIGRVQGVTDVAIYSRAGGLVQLFRQLVVKAIMPVCLPYFSKAVREEQSVVRAYVRGVAIFTGVGWTFLGFLALAAFPTIRTIYGDQWGAAVPLARILCLAGMVELVHYMAKEALLSHGEVKLASRLQLVLQLAQVAGLLAVLPFGLQGACWGMLASAVLGMGLSQWHMQVGTGLRMGQLFTACGNSALVALIALAPVALFFAVFPATESNFLRCLLVGGGLTACGWLLGLRVSGHPLWSELAETAAPLLGRISARVPRKPPA